MPNYEGWWDVAIAEVSDEASVNDARDEYEEALKHKRVVATGIGTDIIHINMGRSDWRRLRLRLPAALQVGAK